MRAVVYRTRAFVRQQWRGCVLLVVLIGLAGGVVLTVAAGARRSATAYDRLRTTTLAADLDVSFEGPPTEDMEATAQEIRAIPGVEAVGRAVYPFVVPAGSGMYPYLDFLAVAGADDEFNRTVDVPLVKDGRLPDPGSPLEAAVIDAYASQARIEVGDRLEVESFAPAQVEALFSSGGAGPPSGPRFALDVVGVVSAPVFVSDSSADFQPKLLLSQGLLEEHGADVATYPGGFTLRLADGAADAPAVERALRAVLADASAIEISPSAEVDRKIEASIDVIVAALAVFALVVALAASVVVAQALLAHQRHHSRAAPALEALGMRRRDLLLTSLCTAAPIAVGGAATAVVVAVAASPLMPLGIARRAEPSPGARIDLAVLVPGAVLIVAVVLALAVLSSFADPGTSPRRVAPDQRSARWTSLLRGSTLRPPAAVGIGMALDHRAGTAWTLRSALAGVAFGVAVATATVVFVTSAHELATSPERYGSPFDAAASGLTGDVLGGAERASLSSDPQVDELSALASDLGRIQGTESNLYSLQRIEGDPSLSVLSGRAPSGPGEVALGAQTARDLDVQLGDRVRIEGTSGGSLEATVVGRTVLPLIDERSAAGRGALLDVTDLQELADPDSLNTDLLVGWAAGVEVAAANRRLGDVLDAEVSAPRTPSDVKNLDEVAAIPRALATIVGLLGGLSAAYAVLSTVRLRRRDLAVLRALGFDRHDLRRTMTWQSTVVLLLGVAVGAPLGVAGGRLSWRAVAGDIGVVDTPTISLLALVALAAVAFVAGAGISAASGRSARRLPIGATLRPR